MVSLAMVPTTTTTWSLPAIVVTPAPSLAELSHLVTTTRRLPGDSSRPNLHQRHHHRHRVTPPCCQTSRPVSSSQSLGGLVHHHQELATSWINHEADNWTAPALNGLGGRRPGHYHHRHADQLVGDNVTKKVSIAFGLILIPLVSVFGSLGNFLSLRVLVHHRMRNSTNMLLAALAFSDLLVLLHALYFSFLRVYALADRAASERLRTLTFPVLGPYTSVVTARITTGLTTMLSVERLVAVYFPMKAKAMCGRFMTGLGIALIFLITTAAFVPAAMKYKAVSFPATAAGCGPAPAGAAATAAAAAVAATGANETQTQTAQTRTCLKMELTSLGHNKHFFLVYGNTLNVLFRLLPILVLILVNLLIALAIKRTWSFRRSVTGGATASYEQNRITLMLLMVSVVFLSCILPGAVHSIMTQVYRQYSRFGAQSNIYTVFGNVTYFLETLNSSVNFVIYMAYSTKFNRTYRQIFSCKRRRPKRGPGLTATQFQLQGGSSRSVVRFPMRPLHGSHSSMTSYRELHILNQLRKHQCSRSSGDAGSSVVVRNGNTSFMVRHAATASGLGNVPEQQTCMLRRYHSKYSISENSYSSHSNRKPSHSGQHSHSENSQGSSSGHGGDRLINELSNHSVELSPEEMYS